MKTRPIWVSIPRHTFTEFATRFLEPFNACESFSVDHGPNSTVILFHFQDDEFQAAAQTVKTGLRRGEFMQWGKDAEFSFGPEDGPQ